jgi:hypothetical protein
MKSWLYENIATSSAFLALKLGAQALLALHSGHGRPYAWLLKGRGQGFKRSGP